MRSQQTYLLGTHHVRVNLAAFLVFSFCGFPVVGKAEIPSASGNCSFPGLQTTPSEDFIIIETSTDDVVRHERTGLEWKRCVFGMTWSSSTASCEGTARTRSWGDALKLAAELDDWRLPNLNELQSIVELCGVEPAINQQVFPDTPASFHWSSSPYRDFGLYKWVINFSDGDDNYVHEFEPREIRLVRDPQ